MMQYRSNERPAKDKEKLLYKERAFLRLFYTELHFNEHCPFQFCYPVKEWIKCSDSHIFKLILKDNIVVKIAISWNIRLVLIRIGYYIMSWNNYILIDTYLIGILDINKRK